MVRYCATIAEVIITDEETQEQETLTVDCSYLDGMLTFGISYPFKEARFYWLYVNVAEACTGEVLGGDEVSIGVNINKSKLFATAQENYQTYSMTSDYYKEIVKPKPKFYVKE